jgi:hypothetical protein
MESKLSDICAPFYPPESWRLIFTADEREAKGIEIF